MIPLTSIWLGREGRIKTRPIIVNARHVVAAHETIIRPTGNDREVLVTTMRMSVGSRIVVRESLEHVRSQCLHAQRVES